MAGRLIAAVLLLAFPTLGFSAGTAVDDAYLAKLLRELVPDGVGAVPISYIPAAKLEAIGEPVLDYIKRHGSLESSDHAERIAAVSALSLVGTPYEVPDLIRIYSEVAETDDDLDDWMRRAVIVALASIYDDDAFEFLAGILMQKDVVERARYHAASVLRLVRDERLIPLFIGTLEDKDRDAAWEAREALLAWGPKSVPYASRVLAAHESYFTRIKAARLLGEIGGLAAVRALKKAARRDDVEYVREAARLALASSLEKARIAHLRHTHPARRPRSERIQAAAPDTGLQITLRSNPWTDRMIHFAAVLAAAIGIASVALLALHAHASQTPNERA